MREVDNEAWTRETLRKWATDEAQDYFPEGSRNRARAVLAAIADAEAREPFWRAVTEQVAPRDEDLLVYTDRDDMTVAFWSSKEDEWIVAGAVWAAYGASIHLDGVVTHWRRIPAPDRASRRE